MAKNVNSADERKKARKQNPLKRTRVKTGRVASSGRRPGRRRKETDMPGGRGMERANRARNDCHGAVLRRRFPGCRSRPPGRLTVGQALRGVMIVVDGSRDRAQPLDDEARHDE
jgi:hypothetical protein